MSLETEMIIRDSRTLVYIKTTFFPTFFLSFIDFCDRVYARSQRFIRLPLGQADYFLRIRILIISEQCEVKNWTEIVVQHIVLPLIFIFMKFYIHKITMF